MDVEVVSLSVFRRGLKFLDALSASHVFISGDHQLFYGLQAVSHPSLDSRLPVILLLTPGYQSSVEDSRLPVILPSGLQTTSPLWTLGYQPSGDFRLPALYEFKVSC